MLGFSAFRQPAPHCGFSYFLFLISVLCSPFGDITPFSYQLSAITNQQNQNIYFQKATLYPLPISSKIHICHVIYCLKFHYFKFAMYCHVGLLQSTDLPWRSAPSFWLHIHISCSVSGTFTSKAIHGSKIVNFPITWLFSYSVNSGNYLHGQTQNPEIWATGAVRTQQAVATPGRGWLVLAESGQPCPSRCLAQTILLPHCSLFPYKFALSRSLCYRTSV